MSQSQFNERTRLLGAQQDQSIYEHNLLRDRKRRVKQFQCCLCTIITIFVLTILIITISYFNNLSPKDSNNTQSNNESSSNNLPADTFIKLHQVLSWPRTDKIEPVSYKDYNELNKAITEGRKALNSKYESEKYNSPLKLNSPSYKHQKVMATSEKARSISQKAFEGEGATKYFYRNWNKYTPVGKICFTNITDSVLTDLCYDAIPCNFSYKYRSYNGSCNNVNHPNSYGVAYRPFRRALPPDYADGISKPRVSTFGDNLPSARRVSVEIHRPYYRDDSKFSVMLAVWGQFLDHDVTATALSQKQNGESISCCNSNDTLPSECFPVYLDINDYFQKFNISCMEFVRSAPAPTCCLGPREQMNQVTAFIDGSVVYGADENTVKSLRTMEKASYDMTDGCNREEQKNKGRYCFLSGDKRANENLHLTSMHLIWARQHNLIAKNLAQLNPHWNDETIFQESRRILSAQMQHITYNEFLPILLGKHVMEKYELSPKRQGYFYKYNPTIDPSVANVFAASAFRFAHSLIPTLIKILANHSNSTEYIQMHKMLFDPFKLYDNGELNKALNGAMNTHVEASDAYFSKEIKFHLFEDFSSTNKQSHQCGLDLVSLNIQRGRDHGLPGYIFWRQHCGLGETRTFEDLQPVMGVSVLNNIKTVYRDVKDIDLYTGALSEKPINGTVLGPTLTCLILDQFIRIKIGDRFWYENPEQLHGFSIDQLNEIRKTSLAGIICDNTDNLSIIAPFVMLADGKSNIKKPCADILKTNLLYWKENIYYINMPKQPFYEKPDN
ncbi:hypothetical protein GWI33_001451 [Rhynchophorus ferrugineus]|uniref:Chorion peroxidase n=1 Tax=Rhynchophorus ferrugineus TaxID=354439 RepID=A0A834J3E1_RHYFE|nr:hypothetical protein GWI33_001451 [Rhynchophorus ferrugineus]